MKVSQRIDDHRRVSRKVSRPFVHLGPTASRYFRNLIVVGGYDHPHQFRHRTSQIDRPLDARLAGQGPNVLARYAFAATTRWNDGDYALHGHSSGWLLFTVVDLVDHVPLAHCLAHGRPLAVHTN